MNLIHGDCLEIMPTLADDSVDMVMADVPYGTTCCKWDSIIPLEPMWKELKRIVKKNGAIVMTASQPFTTTLISSNMGMFKYCWVWEKDKAGNMFNANRQCLKIHEDIVIFSEGQAIYNPQMVKLDKPYTHKNKSVMSDNFGKNSKDYDIYGYSLYTHSYPKSIIRIAKEGGGKGSIHPTQKPVALMEYMIKTYTNKGDTVLDFTMGSGTTGVACKATEREFTGIEKDKTYYDLACKRIADYGVQQNLFRENNQ